VGHLIVPEKYNAVAREKHRAARYEWYLKRGLPIPHEFMPRDELELLEKRRLYNEMTKRGETTANVKAFEPRISMGMNPEDQTGTTVAKVEEDKGKIRRCNSIGDADCSDNPFTSSNGGSKCSKPRIEANSV
jgi:hypothetical protein